MRNRAREVIDVLSTYGWNKGSYVDEYNGRFCILGALAFNEIGVTKESKIIDFYNSRADRKAVQPTIDILNDIVRSSYPGSSDDDHPVPSFNDDDKVTFEDVICVLKKAAATIDDSVR